MNSARHEAKQLAQAAVESEKGTSTTSLSLESAIPDSPFQVRSGLNIGCPGGGTGGGTGSDTQTDPKAGGYAIDVTGSSNEVAAVGSQFQVRTGLNVGCPSGGGGGGGTGGGTGDTQTDPKVGGYAINAAGPNSNELNEEVRLAEPSSPFQVRSGLTVGSDDGSDDPDIMTDPKAGGYAIDVVGSSHARSPRPDRQ